jgi:hypothetical protein
LQTAGAGLEESFRQRAGRLQASQNFSACRDLKKVSKVNQGQLDFLIVSYPGNMFINLYRLADQGKNKKNNLLKYLIKIH